MKKSKKIEESSLEINIYLLYLICYKDKDISFTFLSSNLSIFPAQISPNKKYLSSIKKSKLNLLKNLKENRKDFASY